MVMVRQTTKQITEKHFLNPNLETILNNLTRMVVFLPVIAETPENTTETIENVLEDCNNGVKVIIIDES